MEIIRWMSGDIFSVKELKEIGLRLKKHKLASLSLSYPKEDKECYMSDKSDQNVKLCFKLYDLPFKCK
ncbi:MAG: hypothetical protein ABIJ37_10940 [Pseudomonadota bacterium]